MEDILRVFDLPRQQLKLAARQLIKDNKRFEDWFVEIPVVSHSHKAYRSNKYLVQVFEEPNEMIRLSISKTAIDVNSRRWIQGISWDTLQWIKQQIGYGDFDAVEVFPKNNDIVDVANIRHLWVFLKDNHPLKFIWRK